MDVPAPIPSLGHRAVEFARFYRDNFAMIWRALLRLGVRPDECEDAMQDVFVAAHRRWAHFDGAVERRVWVLGIVRRIAWRARRSEARRIRRHDALAHQLMPPPLGPDDAVARRQAWEALQTFLLRLDDEKREAFVFGELEELGRIELGVVLGINANTAYSRLAAARRRFVDHFAGVDDHVCARLLVGAERAIEPRPEHRARVWSAMLVSLGAPGVAAAPIAGGIGLVGKLGLVGVGVALVARIVTHDPESPPPTTEAAIATRSAAPLVPPSSVAELAPTRRDPIAPSPTPAPSQHVTPPARSSAASTPVPLVDDEALRRELALLTAAREAMVRGDLEAARRGLDEHLRVFGAEPRLPEVRAAIVRDLDTIVRDLDSTSIKPRPGGDPRIEERNR